MKIWNWILKELVLKIEFRPTTENYLGGDIEIGYIWFLFFSVKFVIWAWATFYVK